MVTMRMSQRWVSPTMKSSEQTSRLLVQSLEGKIPDLLIQKTIELCRKLQQDSLPEMNSIIEKLENDEINFDDTAIALMEIGMELAQKSAIQAQQLVIDHIEHEEFAFPSIPSIEA